MGSERLLNKNFRDFYGEPLYLRALKQALILPFVSKIVLTSDAPEHTLDIPSGIIFNARPSHLSQRDTSSSDVAGYIWEKHGSGNDGLLWLQPTSPLRTANNISHAFKKWNGTGSLVSCCKGDGLHERFDQGGYLNTVGIGEKVSLNGAIFLTDPSTLNHSDWSEGAQAFYMDESESVDIDTQSDWDKAIELFEA